MRESGRFAGALAHVTAHRALGPTTAAHRDDRALLAVATEAAKPSREAMTAGSRITSSKLCSNTFRHRDSSPRLRRPRQMRGQPGDGMEVDGIGQHGV